MYPIRLKIPGSPGTRASKMLNHFAAWVRLPMWTYGSIMMTRQWRRKDVKGRPRQRENEQRRVQKSLCFNIHRQSNGFKAARSFTPGKKLEVMALNYTENIWHRSVTTDQYAWRYCEQGSESLWKNTNGELFTRVIKARFENICTCTAGQDLPVFAANPDVGCTRQIDSSDTLLPRSS